MKKTSLILILFLVISCNKNSDEPIEKTLETVTIGSPYLEQVLVDLKIDSDGEINQKILKKEALRVTDLSAFLTLDWDAEKECRPIHEFDFENVDLLDGISNFTNLKKLVLVLRAPLNSNRTNFEFGFCCEECLLVSYKKFSATIENLRNLEEFYFGLPPTVYGYDRGDLIIKNCPKIKKIGSANYTSGIVGYPSEKVISFDEDNFLMDTPSYDKFYDFMRTRDYFEASSSAPISNVVLNLQNLPELESLHLYQNNYRNIKKENCPKFRKLFLFNKSYVFYIDDHILYSPALKNMQELYIDSHWYDEEHTIGGFIQLNSFAELKKISYRYRGKIDESVRLQVNNENNLKNDLKISIYLPQDVKTDGLKPFTLCLDDNVTEEYLSNNIIIESTSGIFDYEAVSIKCNY